MRWYDFLLRCLIMRKNNTAETTVYRKQTHNDIYLHWETLTPEAWKRGTLLFRVHTTCSSKDLLHKRVKHLKHVFITINGFPPWAVSQVISRVEKEVSTTQINQSIINPKPSNVKQHVILLGFYQNKKKWH